MTETPSLPPSATPFFFTPFPYIPSTETPSASPGTPTP
jgi:hypothetical protein